MAEEKKKTDKKGDGLPSAEEAIGEMVKILFVLMILAYLFGRIMSFIGGSLSTVPANITVPTVSFAPKAIVGTSVALTKPSSVFSEPGGVAIGQQPAGVKGAITDGPVWKDGVRYWFVDFETGPDGWVPETTLSKADGSAFDGGDSPVGKPATTDTPVQVLSSPGGPPLGTQPAGATGTITRGPEFKDGQRYWYVDFPTGPDGWVAESALSGQDGLPISAGSTPIGEDVKMKAGADVYNIPGGTPVGSQPAGSVGTVTKGPKLADGQRWWYVDFDEGPDGWVPESILEKYPSINPGQTPVGERAATGESVNVLDSPGGASVGTQEKGASGRITGGPEYANGQRYWYMDFDEGPDGWVPESSITKPNGAPFDSGVTPIGNPTLTGTNTVVRDAPGGNIIGGQPVGARGVVSKGPEFKDGQRWWYVDFESGPDGWVSEDALRGADGSPLNVGSTPIGSDVGTKKAAGVFDDSGTLVGTQEKGVKGTITKGPKYVDGQRYWYVDFEEGPDGWVSERELVPYTPPGVTKRAVKGFFRSLVYLSWLVSLLLFFTVLYIIAKSNGVLSRLTAGINPPTGIHILPPAENEAWKRVQTLVESQNPSDWKLAIIEADSMLDKMLQGMGYRGETVGDRLKAIEASDFTSLDSAWEAHKVRNRIAHEGGDFLITEREARRVVGLYKQVFEEFKLI